MKTSTYPGGIPYIIGNELAERFSYYGMKAILMTFMTQHLLMGEGESVELIHKFGAGVYLFPILGAFLSDFFLGKYKTIISLSVVYTLGHLVMSLIENKTGMMVGLGLIALGSGGIKPCVSAHVGDQFDDSNQNLLDRIFNWFYLAVNLGAFVSTILTPILLEKFGPQIAFGIPGALMLLATLVFWLGNKKYVSIEPDKDQILKDLKNPETLKTIGKLLVVYLFISVFSALYEQTSSTWIIQANHFGMDKTIEFLSWKWEVLPSQIQSINPVMVLTLVPIFSFLVYPFIERFTTIKSLWKIATGMFIAAFSFFLLGIVEQKLLQGETVSISWHFWAFLIITIAEVLVNITALEISYKQAPVSLKSIIMGLYLLSHSLGNLITTGVNHAIVSPTEVVGLAGDKATSLEVKNKTFAVGEKIEIRESIGLKDKNGEDFKGTYLISGVNKNNIQLQGITTGKPIAGIQGVLTQGAQIYSAKLSGKAYFDFFGLLMLAAFVLFIPVAYFFKEKTIVQSANTNLH
ncbi:MAG: MFS transporter [Flavobacteriaceae bacterium]|nr:MAG: MFS transporter [Flavobacteriaceae bacterium]